MTSKFASITMCEHCNSYTVYLGPMSFRMEKEIYESFRMMILENSDTKGNGQTISQNSKYID